MFWQRGLRDADAMFRRFFDRWYDPAARELKGFSATRPDMMQVVEFSGKSAREIALVPEKLAIEAQRRVDEMIDAAQDD